MNIIIVIIWFIIIFSLCNLFVYGLFTNNDARVKKILEDAWINSLDEDIICSWSASEALVKNGITCIVFTGIFCKRHIQGYPNSRIFRFSKLSKYIDEQYKILQTK